MITVFTPTYNRAHTIGRLYESLKKQSCVDFEWIVADDESEDGTSELFKRWENETKNFSIKYMKLKHGGKHRAINKGVKEAASNAFFIVDSDDYLTIDAIQCVDQWFKTVEDDSNFAGVSGLRGYTIDRPIGGAGDEAAYIDATNLEREKNNLSGDKAEVYKTNVLKEFPFPQFENEDFLTEAVVWNQIAYSGYKIRWFPRIIYICNYYSDGLTSQSYDLYLNNPRGYMEYLSVQEKCFGKDAVVKDLFKYYFQYANRYGKNAARKLLFESLDYYEAKRIAILDSMNDFFKNKNINVIAIYGMGAIGKCLADCAPYLNVKISYGIDRKTISSKIKIYNPKDNLPDVDAIIIALKQHDVTVQANIALENTKLFYLKDIIGDEWNQLY